ALVFFFQAEDGIRDRNVTGVQTCALPIFLALSAQAPADVAHGRRTHPSRVRRAVQRLPHHHLPRAAPHHGRHLTAPAPPLSNHRNPPPSHHIHSVVAIIWCTAFRPALNHLASLGLRRYTGAPKTTGSASADEHGPHLLGYGEWTGYASATPIGTARTAKDAVHDITSPAPAGSPPR